MKTNLEKWNYWKGLIDAREKAFVESEVTEIPSVLYSVHPNGGIGEKVITFVTYRNGKNFRIDKRVTKVDVEEIKSFAENNEPLSMENIRFNYEEKHSSFKSSGAVKINELDKFLTKEEAEIKSNEVKEKNAKEEILLKNGHTRCQRCSKVVPDNEAVTEKMISYANFGAAGKVMKFCSGTCAAHEQWSLEG